MCAKQSEGKEHILRERQNALVSINDTDTAEDIEHFNDEQIRINKENELENEKNKDNKDYVKKEVKPVAPAKQMSEFEIALAKLNEATKTNADTRKRLQNEQDSNNGGTTNTDNTANPTNVTTDANKTDTTAATTTGNATATTTKSRLNITALSNANNDVKKDPEALLKDKAVKLGVEFGRPIGNKVALEGAATSEQQARRLVLIPADGSVPVLGTKKPTVTEAAKPKEGEEAVEPTVNITEEQAAEHYSNQFRMGFSNGYNMGYMEGQRVKNEAKAQEKEKAAEELKKSQAYKDGEATGTNLSTATGDAKAAAQKVADGMRTKYLTPVENAPMKTTVVDGVSQQTPDVTEPQKKDAEAYKLGFNAAYTKGQATARKAGEDKIKAGRELPEYKAGADLAKQAVAAPATKTAKQAEAYALYSSEKEKNELAKRGFLETFNLEYQKAMGEARKERMTAASTVDESNPAVAAGKAAAQEQLGKSKPTTTTQDDTTQNNKEDEDNDEPQKAQSISDKAFAAHLTKVGLDPTKDADKAKISQERALFVSSYNKTYIAERKEAAELAQKLSPNNSIKYKQGQEIGKIIGMLTVQGGDTALEENEGIGKLIYGEGVVDGNGNKVVPKPTLKALEEYLKKQQYSVLPKKEPVPYPDDQIPFLENALILARDKEILDYKINNNFGTDADYDRGYKVGYNSGYMVGKAKQSGEKAKTTGMNSSDFKAGEEEGKEVGRMAADVKQKKGSPEAEAKFNVELSNIRAQAQAQGAQFYQGFLSGYNIGYVRKMGGVEPEEKIIIADDNLKKLITEYEKAGDANMVELLQAKYESGYSDNYKSIYEKLTEPFKPKEGGGEKSEEKFATIPSEADLEQDRLSAIAGQEGANGECAKAFADEKKLIDQIKAATVNPEKAKAIDEKAKIIQTEISQLASAFAAGYAAALQKAKDDGYSFIKGFEDKIKTQGATDRTAMPQPAKVNSKQVQKGEEAAEGFASAMRMNAQMKAKGLKPIKGLAMPPMVATKSYAEGYKEAAMRWKVVKLVQSGIPVPMKMQSSELFQEFSAKPKAAELVSVIQPVKTEADDVKVNAPELDPMARPNPLPQTKGDAEKMLDKDAATVAKADIEFYRKKTAIAYLKSLNKIKTARETDPDSKQFTDFTKILPDLQAAFPETSADKTATTTAPPDKNTAITKFTAAFEALKSGSPRDKKRLEMYQAKLSATNGAKIPTAASTPKEVADYVKIVKETITEPNDNSFDKIDIKSEEYAKQLAQLAEISGEKVEVIQKRIDASVTEYQKAYQVAFLEVKNAKTELNEDDETNFATVLSKYGEEIGYADGYVQKVAKLGIENNQKEKAIRIINQYLQETEANIPIATITAIKDIKPDYTDSKVFAITCTPETQQLLTKDVKLGKLYKSAFDSAQSTGAADGIAAYNLSTETFSFTSGKKRQDSDMTPNAGPLGGLARGIFDKLIKTVEDFKLPADLKKTIDNIATHISKAKTADELVRNADVEAFAKTFKAEQKPPPNGDKKATTPPETEAPFAPMLFGAGTFEVGKSLALPLQKELKYESGNIKYDLAANDKFTFTADKTLLIGNENSEKEAVTLYNSGKTLGFVGSGIKIGAKETEDKLFQPKVIIPTLQKQLIAGDSKLESDFIKPYLKTTANGVVGITAENIKKELVAMHNNLMEAINKKEIGDATKGGKL
jgi:hypothetical protein